MKKNTLFLSAAITTFILVILSTLIYKARVGIFGSPVAVAAAAPTATATQAPTDTLQPTDTATSSPTATSAFISPQEAALIASRALGNNQIYSVDTETRYGLDVYKVTFSSGHIVYVNPAGVILSIYTPHAVDVVPTNAPPSKPRKPSGGGGGGGGDGGGGDN